MKKPPGGRFFRWWGDEGIAPYETTAEKTCVGAGLCPPGNDNPSVSAKR